MPNILEEKDWDLLLRRIEDGKCTPFPGAGACSEKISVSSQIANELEKKYDYPMDVSEAQIEKAQKYLDRYFAELHIQVYWHDFRESAAKLRTRLEAFNGGT